MANDTPRGRLDEARRALREAIPRAAQALVALLDAKDERVRLRAAEALLTRAGIAPAGRIQAWQARQTVGDDKPPEPIEDDEDPLMELLAGRGRR